MVLLFILARKLVALGYRINSKVATRFRQWASARLKKYIIKGFTMDDDRLLNRQIQIEREILNKLTTKEI